jgi:hypothetical protein
MVWVDAAVRLVRNIAIANIVAMVVVMLHLGIWP